jgi:hypothetical protein
VKVDFAPEEAWELMSVVVARLLDEAGLPDKDRAAVRRWRSDSMQPGGEPMRALTRKINDDLAQVLARKERSQLRRPDWR